MTLEQMKIFIEAARYNSFTLAAQKLGMTQSAVSLSIRKLEEEFQVNLFERLGRKVVVSEAGQILLGEAERILRDVDLTVRRIEGYQNAGRPRPIIACSRNAYDHWMPGILSRVKRESEMPEIDIICGTSAEVAAWVMRGTADAGVSESMPGHNEFRYYGVFEDQLVLCTTRASAAGLTTPAGWADVQNCSPVIWESNTDLEQLTLEALEQHNIDPKQISHPRLKLNSTAAVVSVAESGRYPAFVPYSATHHLFSSGHLVRLGKIQIPVPYWIFALRNREIEPLAALIATTAGEMGFVGKRPG